MERIELKNRKDQKIVGILEKPTGETLGTCIVVHGWGGHKNKSSIQAIKNAFLESGFQTFNFDATNAFGESEGEYEKATLGAHAEDFEDVVKWAQEQNWFKGPLALTGHSMGGYASTKYAEDHPEEVAFLVPIAPAVSGKLSEEAHKKYEPEKYKELKEKGYIEKTRTTGEVVRVLWQNVEERKKHDLLPNADKITMPTLLLVGSEDKPCLEHSKILFDSIPDGNKEMKIIEDASHFFYRAEKQELLKKYIMDWLALQNIK